LPHRHYKEQTYTLFGRAPAKRFSKAVVFQQKIEEPEPFLKKPQIVAPPK
jgi:hypothetical protein